MSIDEYKEKYTILEDMDDNIILDYVWENLRDDVEELFVNDHE